MYLGRVVETGESELLYEHPRHPVHRGAALGGAAARDERRRSASGSGSCSAATCPRPSTRRAACVFHPRCPRFQPGHCDVETPRAARVRGRPRGGLPLPGRALADDGGGAPSSPSPAPESGRLPAEIALPGANFAAPRPSQRTMGFSLAQRQRACERGCAVDLAAPRRRGLGARGRGARPAPRSAAPRCRELAAEHCGADTSSCARRRSSSSSARSSSPSPRRARRQVVRRARRRLRRRRRSPAAASRVAVVRRLGPDERSSSARSASASVARAAASSSAPSMLRLEPTVVVPRSQTAPRFAGRAPSID